MLKTKFPKAFKSNIYGLSNSNTLSFGQHGIKSLVPGRISANQIEAARRVISRYLKHVDTSFKQQSYWIRIFPYLPLTKKPNETRMGRGKGSVHIWYANIKANQILFEFTDMQNPQELHNLISSKLPLKTKLISHDL